MAMTAMVCAFSLKGRDWIRRQGGRKAFYLLVFVVFLAGCGEDEKKIPVGFAWSVTPTTLSVVRGDEGQYFLAISEISGLPVPPEVQFFVDGVPAGTKAFFLSGTFFPPATVVLFVETTDATPLGSFPLTIRNNQRSDTLSVTLTIEPFQWTAINPSTGRPPGLAQHTAIYDPGTDQMIVFGGGAPGGFSSDLWTLTNASSTTGAAAWNRLGTVTGPSARSGHRAVYDDQAKRMVVWGGKDPTNAFVSDPLWVLTNADGVLGSPAWTQLSESNPPSARFGFSMVYDVGNNRAILFGGFNTVGSVTTWLNEVWVLTNANGLGGTPTWVEITPSSGNIPNPRSGHSAVYDPIGNRMIIFGGQSGTGMSNDVWTLSNANGLGGAPAWQPLSITGDLPVARSGHTAVFDPTVNRMTIFGGVDETGSYLDDLWVLNNADGQQGDPSWGSRIVFHSSKIAYPARRSDHTSVFHSTGNMMFVFAGVTKAGASNDVWRLDQAVPQ